VFVRDLVAGTTRRASPTWCYGQAGAGCFEQAFSGDGRWISFSSLDRALVIGDGNGASDVFLVPRP
jgi:hypothetical protein